MVDTNISVAEKGICLVLQFNKPGNRRKVSTSMIEVDADKDMVGVSKTLLDSEDFKAIARHDGETRLWICSRALPGLLFRSGVYLIPDGLVASVDEYLETRKSERHELIEAFIAVYPEKVEQARESLKALFNPMDYPESDRVRTAFGMEHVWAEFGTPGRLNSISSAIMKRERDKAALKLESAAEECRSALRQGFAQLVDHMADRLSNPEKIFRDTLVTNFKDFLTTFSFRNICDDQDLQDLVGKARTMLDGVTPEHLREEVKIRQRVAQTMEQINTQLDTMIVNRPKRKIQMKEDKPEAVAV